MWSSQPCDLLANEVYPLFIFEAFGLSTRTRREDAMETMAGSIYISPDSLYIYIYVKCLSKYGVWLRLHDFYIKFATCPFKDIKKIELSKMFDIFILFDIWHIRTLYLYMYIYIVFMWFCVCCICSLEARQLLGLISRVSLYIYVVIWQQVFDSSRVWCLAVPRACCNAVLECSVHCNTLHGRDHCGNDQQVQESATHGWQIKKGCGEEACPNEDCRGYASPNQGHLNAC